MNDSAPNSPILETTQEAINLAKTLLREARFGAIATIEAETGMPMVTRTNVAVTMEGEPVFLMSDLSAHTKAIKADPRTSLLVGEPGKGDALAHPRLTLIGQTKQHLLQTEADKERAAFLRHRYINRHPKADLYNQLPDFFIYQLTIERALLNGGFGKAYELNGKDLTQEDQRANALYQAEAGIIEHMNEDHQDAIQLYATVHCNKPAGPWRICGVDPDGIDLIKGQETARLPFETPCFTADEIRMALVGLAKSARAHS